MIKADFGMDAKHLSRLGRRVKECGTTKSHDNGEGNGYSRVRHAPWNAD